MRRTTGSRRTVRPILTLCVLGTVLVAAQAWSQGGNAHVTVTALPDKVIGWSAAGGGVEESLGPGESVVASQARGHTGFAQTSTRLLGYSAGLRQWREVRLGVNEHVDRVQVLPFLILAAGNQYVHGFQEERGHWISMALGPQETLSHVRGSGHVAAAVTNERAVGFSAYTGGFFSIAWSPDERVQAVDSGAEAVVIRTTTRTVILKSQSTGWTEVR